ncbi:MAG: undecaprenyl/decaprenyl-phosphate alpha-N-acetylglucosaminyl 1-phosphate transferase [candidate division Zixibacteria bacterium]|nr:undecaprenyl/decaprenyl-phosphate alpha-N-acetylglucosaminyl 1-phosphate transferase [candidate division Zixibacteria bacterium]
MPAASIVIAVLVSWAVSLLAIPQLIKIGHRYQLLDMPGRHKRHKRPVPILGGLALFAATWITVLVSSRLFPDFALEPAGSMLYIFLGALVIVAVGLADDLCPLSAWIKLAAQVGVGLILYLAGLRVELLTTPFGSIEIGAASVVITVLWVVGLTNAVNLIDGLDGLAAGVSLIAALTMLVIGHLHGVGWVLVFVYALVGFLSVFLLYNRYPARIFLGDSGSMQIGYYFAVFSLIVPLKSFTASALYVPLLVLGVPILEALSSFMRRLIKGRSVMKADRRHLFHLLALAGFSHRQVVLVFYALGVVFGLFALAMYFWNRILVLAFLVVFMVVILALFFILVSGLSHRRRNGGISTKKAAGHGRRQV